MCQRRESFFSPFFFALAPGPRPEKRRKPPRSSRGHRRCFSSSGFANSLLSCFSVFARPFPLPAGRPPGIRGIWNRNRKSELPGCSSPLKTWFPLPEFCLPPCCSSACLAGSGSGEQEEALLFWATRIFLAAPLLFFFFFFSYSSLSS